MTTSVEYTPVKGKENLPRTARRVIEEAVQRGWRVDPNEPIIVASDSGSSLIMKGFDSHKMVTEGLYDRLALASIEPDAHIMLAVSYVMDEEADFPQWV